MFGLNVDVDGVFDDKGRVIATTIAVDGDDQEVTEMAQLVRIPPAADRCQCAGARGPQRPCRPINRCKIGVSPKIGVWE